jgi:hypothetical protein
MAKLKLSKREAARNAKVERLARIIYTAPIDSLVSAFGRLGLRMSIQIVPQELVSGEKPKVRIPRK